jgi:hypothetical protein
MTYNPKGGTMRGKILDEARVIINGERADMYGNPEDSFQLIASLWSVYLELVSPLSSRDVAMMMTLFKIAREKHQHKRDSLLDAIGYLALAADMEGENER